MVSRRDDLGFRAKPAADTKTTSGCSPLAGDRKPRAVPSSSRSTSREPRFSPSRIVAGVCLRSVGSVRGLRAVLSRTARDRWQISTDGGRDPAWARDGRRAVLSKWRSQMMSVRDRQRLDVQGIRTPTALRRRLRSRRAAYRLRRSSRRPTVPDDPIEPSRTDRVTHINVVLNWFEELKRLVEAAQQAGVAKRTPPVVNVPPPSTPVK